MNVHAEQLPLGTTSRFPTASIARSVCCEASYSKEQDDVSQS